MKKTILFASIIALFAFRASAQTAISAKDAAKHIGEKVTICDKIWSTNFLTAQI